MDDPSRLACIELLVEEKNYHLITKLYTPRITGKAERFIQTSRKEWAYTQAYELLAEQGGCSLALASRLQPP